MNIKRYNQLNEEVRDFDDGINLVNIFDNVPTDPKSEEYQRILEIAKKGQLYKYLATGQRNFTFGMLKALHQDSLSFKKNRELKQGIQKFLWRIIPIAFAPIFFPIWLTAQIFGATRAFNKIMTQVLKMKNNKYEDFLINMINKVMEFSEGEIERLFVDDWFYRSFAIEKGLVGMVKKKNFIDFSYYIIEKIKHQNDETVVPPYFVENEFRKYLNRTFKLDPPMQLKTKINRHEPF